MSGEWTVKYCNIVHDGMDVFWRSKTPPTKTAIV